MNTLIDRAKQTARRLRAAAVAFATAARGKIRKAAQFVTQDVWDVEVSALRGLRRTLVRAVRTVYLVARGFQRNECALRASSLTFVTMLSIVPVLALALSLAKVATNGDELRLRVKRNVHEFIATASRLPLPAVPGAAGPHHGGPAFAAPPPPDGPDAAFALEDAAEAPAAAADSAPAAPAADAPSAAESPTAPQGAVTEETLLGLVDKGFDLVEGLNFGALGGIGLLALVWTVIGVIGNVEKAFNRVWGVAETRPLVRKVVDYLAVIVIVPFLAVAASSVPILAVLERKLVEFDFAVGLSRFVGFPFFRALWVLAILSLGFSLVLRGAPNTHVRFRPALMGGFLAAVGFSLWLKLCLSLQIGVARYSQFFGSFAAVPILLFWVYVSWIILLVAAEISFAVQNADTYLLESGWEAPSPRARIVFAAALLRELADRVREGDGLLDLTAFNRSHRVSVRLVRDVAAALVRTGVLAPVEGRHDVYAARVDLHAWTLGDLVRALGADGSSAERLGAEALPAAHAACAALEARRGDWPALRDLPEA